MPTIDHPWYGPSGSQKSGVRFKRRRRKSVYEFLLDEEIMRLELLEDIKPNPNPDADSDEETWVAVEGGYVRRALRYDD